MTHPEKEFEVGSSVRFHGMQYTLIGYSRDKTLAAIEGTAGRRAFAEVIFLTEWNPDPKPKSFEEAREALAKKIDPLGWDPRRCFDMPAKTMSEWAAELRALQPNAPAAAVAGSAELIDSDSARFNLIYRLAQAQNEMMLMWEHIRKGEHGAVREVWKDAMKHICAPSKWPELEASLPKGWTPPPNPVAFDEAAERKVTYKSPTGAMIDIGCDEAGAKITNLLEVGCEMVERLSAFEKATALDEAAERRLFEAKFSNRFALTKDFDGSYVMKLPQMALEAWLSSAKVQRGAVPAVVAEVAVMSEVARELLEIAGPANMAHSSNHFAWQVKLRSLAARLGGSVSETVPVHPVQNGIRLPCPWCSEPILHGEPSVMVDGDRLHLNCAAEEREDATFDRDIGFGDDR